MTTTEQLQDPRSWDDEKLEALHANFVTYGVSQPLYELAVAVSAEVMRRAELRISRCQSMLYDGNPYGFTEADFRQKHDASWYDSRQTEAQWLAELGQPVPCEAILGRRQTKCGVDSVGTASAGAGHLMHACANHLRKARELGYVIRMVPA